MIQPEDCQVSRAAGTKSAPVRHRKYFCRSLSEKTNNVRQNHSAFVIKVFECQTQGNLQSDNAEGTSFKLLHLLSAGMRSMVGRNGVDCAVYKTCFYGLYVGRLS